MGHGLLEATSNKYALMNEDVLCVERVRNKSTEKNPGSSWDSNP